MSKINNLIQIDPPKNGLEEIITSYGHKCSNCHGNGYHWNYKLQEPEKTDCTVCGGSGKLDATISINYHPSK